MRMRTPRRPLTVLLAVAGLGAAVAATAGAGGAAAASGCGALRGTVVLATKDARVTERGDRLYGCALRTGRVRRLAPPPRIDFDQAEFYALDLRGRYVAYAVEQNQDCVDGNGFCRVDVLVVDLSTGRRLRLGSLVTDYGDEYDALDLRATDAVIGSRGSVAFILDTGRARYVFKVEGSAPSGEQTLLDSGPGIPARSLAESGGTIYWTHGETAKSAPLR